MDEPWPSASGREVHVADTLQLGELCRVLAQRVSMLQVDRGFVEPAWVDGRRRGDFVQRRNLLDAEPFINGAEVVVQLAQFARAEDHASDHRLCKEPGERDLRDARSMRLRERAHLLDDPKSMLFIEGQKIEAGETVAALLKIFPRILAGEKTARERTPDGHADIRGAQERHDLVLDIAADQRIVHLPAAKLGPAAVLWHL